MSKESDIKNRLGEKRLMKCGEQCEIVEYNGVRDVTVKFIKTNELVKCQYNQFKIGNVKSRFTPTVYGVGVLGLEPTRDEDKMVLKSYTVWSYMIRRCYDEKLQEKHTTYKNCKVCKDWLFYPNFKKWYEKNYYEIDNQRMCLDKDILIKNNKVYSPDTCVFVTQNINTLFIKKDANRGNLPIGVNWHKGAEKYQANCSIFDVNTGKVKRKHLGYYNTPQEAFESYKKAKEENIKLVADYYKDRIPERLYNAMYKYEVSIDD